MGKTCGYLRVLFLAWGLVDLGYCADSVWVRQEDGSPKRRVGTIVDYQGDFLYLKHSGPRPERIPADRVVRVETSYGVAHQQAEVAFEARRFDEAQTRFREAMKAESREWVQRAELAKSIWCDRNLGHDAAAADQFMILARHDEKLLHLNAAPIHWKTRPMNSAMQIWAKENLKEESKPVARLIACSWLLGSPGRAEAQRTLQQLTMTPEPRIAILARMQQWRALWPANSNPPLADAANRLETLPEALRQGGCFVIGSAYERQKDPTHASIWFLRSAFLYPHHVELATESLWRAAVVMEKDGNANESRRLYQEIVNRYPQHEYARRTQRESKLSPERKPD